MGYGQDTTSVNSYNNNDSITSSFIKIYVVHQSKRTNHKMSPNEVRKNYDYYTIIENSNAEAYELFDVMFIADSNSMVERNSLDCRIVIDYTNSSGSVGRSISLNGGMKAYIIDDKFSGFNKRIPRLLTMYIGDRE